MQRDDAPLIFHPDPVEPDPVEDDKSPAAVLPWKILVVDDEPEIHTVSRLVLENLNFRNRPLTLLGARSAQDAEACLRQHPDIAVILLDVVMETKDAGLCLVRAIREDMRNQAVRIILRTGQPGQAPERRVVADYDINDYKAKSELTADRLYTSVVAALRAYEDIRTIESFRENAFAILGDQMALMHDLLAISSDALAVIDPHQVLSACSTAFANLLGTTPDTLLGETLQTWLPTLGTAMAEAESGTGEAESEGFIVHLRYTHEGRPLGAIVKLTGAHSHERHCMA